MVDDCFVTKILLARPLPNPEDIIYNCKRIPLLTSTSQYLYKVPTYCKNYPLFPRLYSIYAATIYPYIYYLALLCRLHSCLRLGIELNLNVPSSKINTRSMLPTTAASMSEQEFYPFNYFIISKSSSQTLGLSVKLMTSCGVAILASFDFVSNPTKDSFWVRVGQTASPTLYVTYMLDQ
ncbi:uncharacterized protein UV8b_07431 [Ustilaginoidea virens]|uniref:Uncharacterized protein n=1 Tax=Ustilaginoidea virens TaxID=1159556 RepID=A0A8E5HXH0_USTVR|nr:uncharacterized protein UV8b_07431 [Ustilaginoidea virens]QUC23190.1 hypothetical protein UV8b_07431 [Ustilaginoidea virens]